MRSKNIFESVQFLNEVDMITVGLTIAAIATWLGIDYVSNKRRNIKQIKQEEKNINRALDYYQKSNTSISKLTKLSPKIIEIDTERLKKYHISFPKNIKDYIDENVCIKIYALLNGNTDDLLAYAFFDSINNDYAYKIINKDLKSKELNTYINALFQIKMKIYGNDLAEVLKRCPKSFKTINKDNNNYDIISNRELQIIINNCNKLADGLMLVLKQFKNDKFINSITTPDKNDSKNKVLFDINHSRPSSQYVLSIDINFEIIDLDTAFEKYSSSEINITKAVERFCKKNGFSNIISCLHDKYVDPTMELYADGSDKFPDIDITLGENNYYNEDEYVTMHKGLSVCIQSKRFSINKS